MEINPRLGYYSKWKSALDVCDSASLLSGKKNQSSRLEARTR